MKAEEQRKKEIEQLLKMGFPVATESRVVADACEKKGIRWFCLRHFLAVAYLKGERNKKQFYKAMRRLFEAKKEDKWKELYGEEAVEVKEGLTSWSSWQKQMEGLISALGSGLGG